ncbi:zf-HC2 domain-containing protein [Brasilonema sp. UFV-L1]|uniref:anti-sigma factor family protein n=1 Tax=Brasilonema sp. UFV-L1 TaxID=2234130 RepID=UPI00145EB0AA|nr:zf-HC2 domain-containing protein [Brasilonema sp. UFV-L1]NMG05867.1 transcriptional regulator [Brasilonema sp. UFV-L1]
MTTDSQFDDHSPLQTHKDLQQEKADYNNESTGAMDMVKRDRFELLSAYLDGEVTAAERKQVEEWLAEDATVQRLYARLLKLRQGVRALPVPEPQQSLEETVEQVMTRLHRRPRLVWMAGGAAVAACVIGTITGLLTGESRIPQLAQNQPIQRTHSAISIPVVASPLSVAINYTVIPIPKTAEASLENSVDKVEPQSQDLEHELNLEYDIN